MTEDEVLPMDESIFGDVDEMSLPELPDSVWMRLLANALDPDAPPAGLDLIPVDEPVSGTPDDDDALLGDDWAADGADGTPTADGSDDGSDSATHADHADHAYLGGHDQDDQSDHGMRDGADASDSGFGAHPWQDSHDDPTTGGF